MTTGADIDEGVRTSLQAIGTLVAFEVERSGPERRPIIYHLVACVLVEAVGATAAGDPQRANELVDRCAAIARHAVTSLAAGIDPVKMPTAGSA